jgi:hypothetical protein
MKMTETKSTSGRAGLLREVEASLQTGRIDAGQAEMILKGMAEINGLSRQ